jgi:hypothetical protein
VLQDLEHHSGIKKIYLALIAVVLAVGVVLGGFGFSVIMCECAWPPPLKLGCIRHLVGFVFPLYMSFKCLESPSRDFIRFWCVIAAICSLARAQLALHATPGLAVATGSCTG